MVTKSGAGQARESTGVSATKDSSATGSLVLTQTQVKSGNIILFHLWLGFSGYNFWPFGHLLILSTVLTNCHSQSQIFPVPLVDFVSSIV